MRPASEFRGGNGYGRTRSHNRRPGDEPVQRRLDSPIAKGYSDFGRGIGDLVKGISDLSEKKADKANLAKMTAFIGDGKALYKEGMRLGIPLPKIREMVNIETMLAGKKPDSYTLAPGAARYGAGGAEIARNPAAVKDYRTSEQQNVSGFLERNPGATESDYFKMKRSPGVTVDARSMGTIPTDHRVKYDAQGRPERYEVIAGIADRPEDGGGGGKGERARGRQERASRACRYPYRQNSEEGGRGRRPVRHDPRYRHGRGGNGRRSRHQGARRFQTCRFAQSQYRIRRAESDAREFADRRRAGASQRARAGLSAIDNRERWSRAKARNSFLENLALGAERIQPRHSRAAGWLPRAPLDRRADNRHRLPARRLSRQWTGRG